MNAPNVKMPSLGPGTASPAPDPASVEVDERFAGLDDPLADIPDDTTVRLDDVARRDDVRATLERLEGEFVGMRPVKARVREIASLLVIDRLRQQIGLAAETPTLHMCFTGNPGTGKTSIAQRMGSVLRDLGYVRKGHLVTVTRDDLVGQYVGHTAPKTHEVLKRAMGGVLFIDEAYSLYRADNERDYGQEVVELLLQVMEDRRKDLVVVMAGYADRMDKFFSDVPGLSSRIAHHLDFPDYSLDELIEIARLMLDAQRYRFAGDAETAFRDYLTLRKAQPRFANGRSVRNGLDRARLRQAIRLYDAAERGHALTKKDLVTIEAEDILASRVFGGATSAAAVERAG